MEQNCKSSQCTEIANSDVDDFEWIMNDACHHDLTKSISKTDQGKKMVNTKFQLITLKVIVLMAAGLLILAVMSHQEAEKKEDKNHEKTNVCYAQGKGSIPVEGGSIYMKISDANLTNAIDAFKLVALTFLGVVAFLWIFTLNRCMSEFRYAFDRSMFRIDDLIKKL